MKPLLHNIIGLVKLMELHLKFPAVVHHGSAQQAVDKALNQLQAIDTDALQLAEAYRIARHLTPPQHNVSVALTGAEGTGLMVIIMDGQHHMETIYAKTPTGLAALMRVGHGGKPPEAEAA